MNNAALELPLPSLDTDDFEVEITVRSWKHDCHTAYRLHMRDIEDYKMSYIIREMTDRLEGFIKEKKDAV